MTLKLLEMSALHPDLDKDAQFCAELWAKGCNQCTYLQRKAQVRWNFIFQDESASILNSERGILQL